ncbi:MAG: galactokinase [Gaiellaceae bacterium]
MRGATSRERRRFFAPGRVNLIGEYTDLIGGFVLPVAIELGITLDGEASETTTLVSDADALGWERYVDAVESELRELGRPEIGVRGSLASTLPLGAGLSSSAALEVVVGLALCAVADFPLGRLELAQLARRAEHRAVGVPSGLLDQAASLLASKDNALLLNTGTLTYEHVAMPPGLAVIVVHSGVERRLEDTGYATRKQEIEDGQPKRLRHIESENERVLAAVDALRRDDRAALGRLFRESHESLRDDLEVSVPELDAIVERAYALGAVAARLTGGGFGGSAVVLADADSAARIAAALPRAIVCRASGGAREL